MVQAYEPNTVVCPTALVAWVAVSIFLLTLIYYFQTTKFAEFFFTNFLKFKCVCRQISLILRFRDCQTKLASS